MNALIVLIFLGCVLNAQCSGAGSPWNYENEGPDAWPHSFQKCKGLKQSPIDIVKANTEHDKNLKPFLLQNYDSILSWNITHNGHGVVANKLDGTPENRVTAQGSDFDSQFELLQFHFHWGYNSYHGSEHFVNGQKFPLELHLVHQSGSGTYAVLGFLFKLSKNNNPALDTLLEGVRVAKSEDHSQKVSLSLISILPKELSRYFRYSGSFTTPPCTEGVIWTVFNDYIEISSEQMLVFRNNQVKLNFREPQRLFNRKVFSSFPTQRPVVKKPAATSQDHGKKCQNAAATSQPLSAYLFTYLALGCVCFNKL